MDDSSRQSIRRRLNEYLTDPAAKYWDVASRFEALPIYSDMGGTLFITPTLQVLMQSDGGTPSEVSSPEWKLVAFVAAAERFSELKQLLPTRPDDASDCSLCAGTGRDSGGAVAGLVSVSGGQRSDGRFQIMEEGELAPLMVGYEYVLVDRNLAEYVAVLDLPRLGISEAVLYGAWRQQEVRTHSQLHIGQRFSSGHDSGRRSGRRKISANGRRLLVRHSSPEVQTGVVSAQVSPVHGRAR
jgi:hypothetical protein